MHCVTSQKRRNLLTNFTLVATRLEHGVERISAICTEVKNAWSYTCTTPYVLWRCDWLSKDITSHLYVQQLEGLVYYVQYAVFCVSYTLCFMYLWSPIIELSMLRWLLVPSSSGKKVKYPRYRPTWPRGVQEVKAPRFHDTRHTMVVRSSPPLPSGIFLEAESTPDLSNASEKSPSDTTGDRSRDLPTSSAAP